MPADESAARVIRALLDYGSIWTTHDLVELSKAPAADVRRIIDDLRSRSLVERRRGGIIAVPDWSDLLARWAAGSPAPTTGNVTRWNPTGSLKDLFAQLATSPLKYALTGTHAAAFWTSTPAEDAPIIYTPDPQAAAMAWDFTPSPAGAVLLVEPLIDVVYIRRRSTPAGLRLAAPTQVLADLLAARDGTHANHLHAWMRQHIQHWRY